MASPDFKTNASGTMISPCCEVGMSCEGSVEAFCNSCGKVAAMLNLQGNGWILPGSMYE